MSVSLIPHPPATGSPLRRIVRSARTLFRRGRAASGSPLGRIYRTPAFDLGRDGDARLAGIYSPIYDDETVRRFVQGQFLEDASVYVAKYHGTAHFGRLLAEAFDRAGLAGAALRGLTILDIGSGSGNSIFPLMDLCPGSLVIGSDISVEMLVHLKQYLIRDRPDANCLLLQLNAEELDFAPGSIDLIVGASVLHHLVAPDATIAGCARILKKGGHAIFFEPFREGNCRLSDLFKAILSDPRRGEIDADVARGLGELVVDIDVRAALTKDSWRLQCLDDKWLFSREFFRGLAREHGFSGCDVYPLHAMPNIFDVQMESSLRLKVGRGRDGLPGWAWEIVREFDAGVSDDAREGLLTEGAVILRR